ncbi:dTDP-4-dehydrorhamnose 3,5-epimerase [Jejudonia soesokkakensis]|uniref:dTDP-4-dehydrorhamnose 3,5-epimerase n=1 Tax=Jejudonia soesokkakensis TaxID=1323432 RepID=A0ABW2MN36_9FLAO
MKIEHSPLQGCFLLKPAVFEDERGLFCETFNAQVFEKKTNLYINFVQDNQSISSYGVIRGMHFQTGEMAQAKLVRVVEGKVLDIVVDLRKDSKTFGQHYSVILTAESFTQLFVPRGFAHGFITLSKRSVFAYKCDNYYDTASEGGIIYNDGTLNLDWQLPTEDIIISEKDKQLPTFKEVTQ